MGLRAHGGTAAFEPESGKGSPSVANTEINIRPETQENLYENPSSETM